MATRFLDYPEAGLEVARTIGSGIVGDIPAGLEGLAQLVGSGGDYARAAGAVERARERYSYTPKTELGQRYLGNVASAIHGIGETIKSAPGMQTLQDAWGALTETSPAAGALMAGAAGIALPRGAKGVKKAQGFDPPKLSPAVKEMFATEPDIIRSLKTLPEMPPASQIKMTAAERKALRSEVPTTPGASASEADWAKWGEGHGVNMRVTEPQSLGITDLTSKREVRIPGGLEGTFSIPDLFWIKANNIDPAALPKDVHDQLMQKFMRTYDRGAPDAKDKFNALNFALLSPNAPLTQNEFLAARTRLGSNEDVAALAGRVGEKNLGTNLAREAGVAAASKGGMGVLGTADMANQARLAELITQKPEMFDPSTGETVRDVTRRVMNQVPGLGPKTASLGTPWLDLGKGNTSAVDLHMIRNSYERLLNDPQMGDTFRARMAGLLKMPEGSTVREILANPEAEKAAIKIVGGDSTAQVYRTAKGELKGGADPVLAPDRLAYEPKTVQDFNPFYQRVVDYVDESRGANPVLPLFPEQWRKWDIYRGRVEPHEMAHPDWSKLPKQSWSEMQAALTEHKAAGYTQAREKTMKESDWRKLYYGQADPALLGATAAGGAAALGGYTYFMDREETPAAPGMEK